MLTCGSGGSTGQQIVNAINANTQARGFIYDAQTDILDIGDDYEQITSLSYSNIPAGVYMITFSATFSHASTTNATLLKLIYNGNEEIFQFEASDVNDRIPISYSFPDEYLGGENLTVELEMAREGGTGPLNCYFANLMVQRVGENTGF